MCTLILAETAALVTLPFHCGSCPYNTDALALILCGSSQIIHTTYPHGRSMEIPRGRGDLKAKLLEGQYEAKLEFPRGCWGAKQKTFRGGSMDIFWNNTLYDRFSMLLITCLLVCR